LYKTEEEEVMVLTERVSEAQRFAKMEMKEQDDKRRGGSGGGKKKRNEDGDADDTEESMGVRKRLKPNRNDNRGKKNYKR
jgi:ATP-dependent RNA helicase DDX47/RRP3